MVINEKIEKALAVLPDKPGVYLMHDITGRIIYVGKAKNLHNRVHSYFRASGRHSAKVAAMTSHVDDIETIMTDSEIEALILECNLIKKYRPRYNIMLRDDKTYPYLKITLQDEFPRMYITRHVTRDGARYYGPYPYQALPGALHRQGQQSRIRRAGTGHLPGHGRQDAGAAPVPEGKDAGGGGKPRI